MHLILGDSIIAICWASTDDELSWGIAEYFEEIQDFWPAMDYLLVILVCCEILMAGQTN